MLRAITTLCALSLCLLVSAQTLIMGNGNFTGCSATFYDSGGFFGTYDAMDSLETVICPIDSIGDRIRLNFGQIDLASGDTLRFFDGLDQNAPEIFPITDPATGHPFSIQASTLNISGCLTITFVTNQDADVGQGWQAGITCTARCQRIVNSVLYGDSSPEVGSIEFCIGNEVNLTAAVSFPDNNQLYEQRLDSMEFYWLYGSDTIGLGPNVLWLPEEPGFGQLRLHSVDQQGCTNVDYNQIWAFIGPSPSVEQTGPEELMTCPGDTVVLYTSSTSNEERPGFYISAAMSDSSIPVDIDEVLLVDIINDEIRSTIVIEDYPEGATVGDEIALDSIEILFEHSYSGDLEMEIRCPNGSTVLLTEYPNGNGTTNFGEPYATGPVDENAYDVTLGIPYTYTFSPYAELSLRDFEQNAPVYVYSTVPSQVSGISHTYADTYFPSGSYLPEESMDYLDGCPLNGEWEITILDNLGLDNGHLFGWAIHFDNSSQGQYDTLNTTSWVWESDDIIVSQSQESAILVPTAPGTETLTLTIDDLFGCTVSAEYQITVLEENSNICQGFAPTVPELSLDPILWPNPFSGEINVSLPTLSEDTYWRIFSANGQLMSEGATGQTSINTTNWPTGLYLFQIVDRTTGSSTVERMVKQ